MRRDKTLRGMAKTTFIGRVQEMRPREMASKDEKFQKFERKCKNSQEKATETMRRTRQIARVSDVISQEFTRKGENSRDFSRKRERGLVMT